MTEIEKERCPYELYVEEYFGLPNTVQENDEIKTDFGMLVDLLCGFEQKLKASPLLPTVGIELIEENEKLKNNLPNHLK